jgi:hypothetical protein
MRGIFPILDHRDTVSSTTMPALRSGDLAQIDAAPAGHDVPAAVVTTPIFVDFEREGGRAQLVC